MADIEEKNPTTFWPFLVFIFIEVLMIVCLVPNKWLDTAIMTERKWVVTALGSDDAREIKLSADQLFTKTMNDSGVRQTVGDFFVPSEEERERSQEWEGLANLWLPLMESRGEALVKIIYHIHYRFELLLMWLPYMVVMLVPSIFGGYMTWNIKRYGFAYSSPFWNKYSSKLISFSVTAVVVSFLAPLPIPPMIIPIVVITLIPIAFSLLIGNLPKRI